MKNNLLLAFFFLSGLLIACTKDDKPTLCGSRKTINLVFLENKLVDTSGGTFSSYMEAGKRVFAWSPWVQNVCPDEHVTVKLSVVPTNINARPFFARGRIDWYVLFERTVELPWDSRIGAFQGTGEVGLKQAFGESRGSFFPVVEVVFTTKGSYKADSTFLREEVNSIIISADYWEFNP